MATAHASPFKGLRVFISRKDFSPQFIEAALDMLKENGAEVCICANITCNASSDFHVLPSSQHEKVAEYLSHGCNIVGPDCLVGCAKEHRPFPRRGYTCCLAMEGVKILATGFEKAEKAEIEKLVTSMCGEIESKAITNITFIIAKDVLAAKYKFALNNLRKPILKIDWLFQCWREHRLVPYEPFRMPPFAGLTICATNIPLEERKEIEDACIKNGGSYSADLTKKCTHLIANVPQGDKFKVARRWGTVKIVNRQWFGQCLASKACLDEDLFPVNAGKEKAMTISQVSGPPPYISSLENKKSEIVMSSATSVVSNTVSSDRAQCFETSNDCTRPETTLQDEEQSILLKRSEESEFDEENMYLSNCRVYFSGFTAPDLRKYVNMIRDGGGTRFMEFNDRVTHVIVGKLTDSAQKEIRQNGSMNIIQVVGPLWLEECNGQRKEVAITQKHILPDGFLSKGSSSQEKSSVEGVHQQLSRNQSLGHDIDKSASCLEQFAKDKKDSTLRDLDCSTRGTFAGESHLPHNNDKEEQHGSQQSHAKESKHSSLPCSSEQKSRGGNKMQLDVVNFSNTGKLSSLSNGLSSDAIFKGYIFAIHTSFPMERRAEIVQWVIEGGGSMENEGSSRKDAKRKIDFLVLSHGSKLTAAMMMQAKPVSSHWIRFCLEEKKLLSPDSHILYRPLQCQVPFPGFQGLRICVSQYEEKDRLLLRNLCFVLEAKFNEKLSKKITHLLCKVKDGQKYHAACNWGIEVTTADWLFACVSKDKFLPLINFQPRELSAAEKNTGILGMTQCPSQTAHLVSGEAGSQWTTQTDASQSQEAKRVPKGSAKKSQSPVDASVAHLSERNKYFVSMQALPSQDEAPFLDPWDEQTARWSECDDTKHKSTVHEEKFIPTSQDKGDSSNSKAVQLSPPCSTTAYGKSTSNQCASLIRECRDPSDLDQQTTSAADKENHHSSDVAAAIEGLLAQTSKLKGNGLKGLGLDQEISPEHTTLKRTREEPCFKRPKRQALSSEKAEELGTSKSPLRDLPAFDESQLESQIIGYDEDHTGKHLIMERVRTRSMSTTDLSKSAAWRTDGLGRLFKVAEANK